MTSFHIKFGALQGSDILDKVKSALPFQTLSVFDLAEAEAYQSPPQENQNADFGPNEVTKDSIGDISLDANNPFDTAAPGEQRSAVPLFDTSQLITLCGAMQASCASMIVVHQRKAQWSAEILEVQCIGRSGQTFGENGPGSGDTGAVNESEVKDKVRPCHLERLASPHDL